MSRDTILKITDLHQAYEAHQVLKGINLTVKKSEVVVILGPSGCGKSTFLRCLNGLETFQKGHIEFDGGVIDGREPANWPSIRQKIGMVFQSYDLFPHKTVLENILLAPVKVQKREVADATQEAREWLTKVGLLDKENDYPRALSGGQKQRIAIVRALLMHPEIMLFDEITASLDPEMVREVLEVLQTLAREGMTMLIVTHELNFARQVAHRIIFMDGGKIIEEASPQAFFTEPKSPRARQFLNVLNF